MNKKGKLLLHMSSYPCSTTLGCCLMCVGGDAGLVVGAGGLLPTLYQLLSTLCSLVRLAEGLEGALLGCRQLANVCLARATGGAEGGALVQATGEVGRGQGVAGWELVLGFVTCPGVGGLPSGGGWPCRLRVVVPLGGAMQPCGDKEGRGTLEGLSVRVLQPMHWQMVPGWTEAGAATQSLSAVEALGAMVWAEAGAAVGRGEGVWTAMCQAAVKGMACISRVPAPVATLPAPVPSVAPRPSGTAEVSCAAAAMQAAPALLHDNPLFTA